MNPHPYVKRRGKYEHVAVAERALGHRIPTGAEVPHVNGNKRDNRPANLVLCESRAYHGLLHRRARALRRLQAADEKHAVKIANEVRAQMVTSGEWDSE